MWHLTSLLHTKFCQQSLEILDMKNTERKKDSDGLQVVFFMYFSQAMHNNVRRKQMSCNGTLPSGTWCKQMVISCWSVHSRRHIWHEEAGERVESYLPKTWSLLCYTWSTGSRPLYTMWQRYPGNTRWINIVSETLYLPNFQIWFEVYDIKV